MNLALMLPELVLTATAVCILVLDLFVLEKQRHSLVAITLVGLVLALVAAIVSLPVTGEAFGGRFIAAPVASWFKIIFLLGGLGTVAMGWGARGEERSENGSEFLAILLLTQVGMLLLMSATDITTLYISLELSTIPLFALVAWKRGSQESSEAALKYIVFGALATGLLLYGLGLLYGVTGTLDLSSIRDRVSSSPAIWLAAGLILSGIGFKMTLAPFHFWAADVYQGAPTSVTAYLSIASKAAGLAFLFQLMLGVFGNLLIEWQWLVAIMAAVTMTVGNLVAIVQHNIKRFMAFSSISQAGNIFLGLIGPSAEGVTAMLFYLLVFVATNISVFGVVFLIADQYKKVEIDDYRGLSRTHPLIALILTLGVFGLAGIPPLAGFVGKFFLFSVASKAGMHWLVVIAALNATVSLYYYLRVVRAMYILPPDSGAPRVSVSPVMAVTLLVTSLAGVLLGIFPQFYQSIALASQAWLR